MRVLQNGRELEEEDVQDILGGPDVNSLPEDKAQRGRLMATAFRQKNILITMINTIMAKKGEDEWAREHEYRAQNRAGQ